MAYNPKTGKGLGRFYDANHRAFRAREWRGFRDTFYDFFRWLYLYGFMAVKVPGYTDCEIEFTYETPGLSTGIKISLAALFAFVFYVAVIIIYR